MVLRALQFELVHYICLISYDSLIDEGSMLGVLAYEWESIFPSNHGLFLY